MIKKDNFGYLGEEYQFKLVNAFVLEPHFFQDINTIIDQNMFTQPTLKAVVGMMKDYYAKEGSVPGYDIIDIMLRDRARNEDDLEICKGIILKLRKTSTEGMNLVEEKAEYFFRQQEMGRLSKDIQDAIKAGDDEKYAELYDRMGKVMSATRHSNDSSHPLQTVDNDLSKEHVVTIPTGIKRLDDCLGGGLDKGKVGIIIGSMGFGKTSMTTCMAANAAAYKCDANLKEGFKVLQIIFEDTHRDIHRKYFSKISQVETCKLNENEETTEKVRKMLANAPESKMINDNIVILRLPSGEKTASDIKDEIKKKINEGFKPDMVIVDYFGCVAPEHGTSKSDITDRESKTMRKFETMAAELDIAMWIPVQGNRDSITTDLVTNDKIGGSISKNQIAQVVISITRSVDDIHNQRATLSVLKNRSGSAGVTLNGIIFNNGTCTIESDEATELDSALAYNEYAQEKEKQIIDAMAKQARAEFKLKKTKKN